MKKRILSLFLALVLCLSLVPAVGAAEVSLLSGTLPPGIELRHSEFGWNQNGYMSVPALIGIPNRAGHYEATLKVELADGRAENRRITILVSEEQITQSREEFTVQPGKDQTISLLSGHAGEVFMAERLNGDVPPGLTFFSDGGNLQFCGTPTQPGSFTSTYRVVLTSGQVIDHTVTALISAQYKETSESFSMLRGTEYQTALTFEGADQVYDAQQISGELPPGVSFGCSMSEAPNYSGTPWSNGTYRAVFRILLADFTYINHTVTVTVFDDNASIDLYSMDLSLGETTVPKNDMDTWLDRSLSCMVASGQIRVKNNPDGSASLDLDKDENKTWDVTTLHTKDGAVIFRQLDSSSLTGDDFSLKLNADALSKAKAMAKPGDSVGYAAEIAFHLNTNFDLYIAGTQVTSRNRADILGKGVFSFDGVDTLFIHGDYIADMSEYVIRNGIDGLTIRTDKDSTLSSWGSCIETTRSLSLTATVSPKNASNKLVTWESNKPAVASVDSYGVVTGKSPGSAVITGKTVDGGKTNVCTVNVVWYFNKSINTITTSSAATPNTPVIVASYDAKGQFLGAVFVTSAREKAPVVKYGAKSITIMWINLATCKPKCAAEKVTL